MDHYQLHGRLKGAIGIFYALPCIDLEGDPESIENLERVYEKYEHVSRRKVEGYCDRCGHRKGEAR